VAGHRRLRQSHQKSKLLQSQVGKEADWMESWLSFGRTEREEVG
jgi:hypothetical protein